MVRTRELVTHIGSVPIRRNPIRRNANPNPNLNPNFGESGFGEWGRHPHIIVQAGLLQFTYLSMNSSLQVPVI